MSHANRHSRAVEKAASYKQGQSPISGFKFTWNDDSSPGFLVRWLSPGDYLAIGIPASDDKPRLYKREADGARTTLATGSTGLGLSASTQYEAKVVVSDNNGEQELDFYIDLNP